MRLNFLGGILAVLVVAALIVGYSSLFTVYQTQQALVVRLGQPVRVVNEPGLQRQRRRSSNSVVYIDKRILDLEAPPQEVIASDQKRLVVDAFARYRIQDALRFYQTLGSISGANSQLVHSPQFGTAPRAGRGNIHPCGARSARRTDVAHPRTG